MWLSAKPTKRAASKGMWVRGREDHFYFREFAGEALMFPSSASLPISAVGDTDDNLSLCWAKVTSSLPFAFQRMTSSVEILIILHSVAVSSENFERDSIFSSRFLLGRVKKKYIAHNLDQRPLFSANISLAVDTQQTFLLEKQ